jgi:O-methyltransferase involved in polyketide biosynthesis
MAEKREAELGAVQKTLFIPLAARARETGRKHPALRDPKAVEVVESIDFDASVYGRGWGGFATVLRTLTFDWWVREFLARHPSGTVVELGTGLNTRFERVDNGTARWIDLDLPDTIELRRQFFADTERRRMIAASLLDDGWLDAVEKSPGPYFFVSEGVLVYLQEADVTGLLARISKRFPGARIAFDTYPRQTFERQHKLAAKRGLPARWAWSCDDPSSLERAGLRLIESAWITRPPDGLRSSLPARFRYLLPAADPFLRQAFTLSLFSSGDPSKSDDPSNGTSIAR